MCVLILPFLATGCQTYETTMPTTMSAQVRDGDSWSSTFDPPTTLVTSRVRFEPLGPEHAQRDYDAFMRSREHLQDALGWGDWPREDMTVEENRRDLQRHADEFERREAYAYAVLTRDASRELGCVYLNPASRTSEQGVNLRHARLAYWVIEGEERKELDTHIVESMLQWIRMSFPIDEVRMSVRLDHFRGREVMDDLGLPEVRSNDPMLRTYIWRRR